MLTALRSRTHRIGDDSGFTLVEMLVAIVIAAIVGSGAVATFMGVNNVTRATADTSTITGSGRAVLQSWSRYLQVAGPNSSSGPTVAPVVGLTPTSIDFWAFLNISRCSTDVTCPVPVPTEITLSLVNGQLGTQLNRGAMSYADLDRGAASASPCLFTAYASNTALGCSPSPGQLSSITSVKITFAVATQDQKHTSSYSTRATFTVGVAPKAA